jgi:hypothetical protein
MSETILNEKYGPTVNYMSAKDIEVDNSAAALSSVYAVSIGNKLTLTTYPSLINALNLISPSPSPSNNAILLSMGVKYAQQKVLSNVAADTYRSGNVFRYTFETDGLVTWEINGVKSYTPFCQFINSSQPAEAVTRDVYNGLWPWNNFFASAQIKGCKGDQILLRDAYYISFYPNN